MSVEVKFQVIIAETNKIRKIVMMINEHEIYVIYRIGSQTNWITNVYIQNYIQTEHSRLLYINHIELHVFVCSKEMYNIKLNKAISQITNTVSKGN
jgi:hypothetical protein